MVLLRTPPRSFGKTGVFTRQGFFRIATAGLSRQTSRRKVRREAERMRDEALAEDEMAKDKAAHEQIVRRLTEELNRV